MLSGCPRKVRISARLASKSWDVVGFGIAYDSFLRKTCACSASTLFSGFYFHFRFPRWSFRIAGFMGSRYRF